MEVCGIQFTEVEFEKYLEGFFDEISNLLTRVLGRRTPIWYPEDIVILDPTRVRFSASMLVTRPSPPHIIVKVSPVERLFSPGVDRYGFYIKEKEAPDSHEIVLRMSFPPRIRKVTSLKYRGLKWTVIITEERNPPGSRGWIFLFGIGPIPFHISGHLSDFPHEVYLETVTLGVPTEFLMKSISIER